MPEAGAGQRLRIGLLGPLRVVHDGTEVPLGPSRQRAVFALLASRAGQAVSREELIAGVWGITAPASAAGSVYTYVSALRRALTGAGVENSREVLFSARNGYTLRVAPSQVDLVEFSDLVAHADRLSAAGEHREAVEQRSRALELFRGDPYTGVPGPHAEHERGRWTDRGLSAVEARARDRLVLGETDDLPAELASLARNFPLRESLHALLMLALSRAGRQAEALDVYAEARGVLRTELGAEPGRALLEAHAAVLAGAAVPTAAPEQDDEQEDPVPARGATDVFVGREAEVERLRERLVELSTGAGGAVHVEGEPGIGKSELLALGLAGARRLGFQVGWAVADQLAAHFPLQVLMEFAGIDPVGACSQRGELSRRQHTSEPPGDDDTIQIVADHTVALVDEMTARAPTVLVIDDLQWADEASVHIWRRLVTATRQLPLLLVTAARSRHGRADLDGLRAHVAATGGDVVALGPLSDAESDALTTALVGARPGSRLRRLVAHADGNPMYLREMLGELMREQALDVSGGTAEVAQSHLDDAPRTLFAAVRRTWDALPDRTREVLRWAAALGAEATTEQIAALSARPVAEVAQAVEDAITANVLAEATPRLVFRHPVMREAVYEAVPVSMRELLHLQAAQALAAEQAPARRVAEQLVAAASDLPPWVCDWLVVHVAELASRAPLIAVDLLEQALEGGGPRDPRREVLLTALVRVLFKLVRDPEAQVKQALAISTDPTRSTELRQMLAAILLRQGKRDLAVRALTEVETDPSVPEIWRLRHKSLLAHIGRDISNVDSAELNAKTAHAEAVANKDAYLIAHSLQTRWLVDTVRRDHRAALRHVDEAIFAVAGRTDMAAMHAILLDNRMFTLQNLDRLGEVDEALRKVDELTVVHRLPTGPQVPAAIHHYWTGRWDQALTELDAATEDGPAINYGGLVDPGPSWLLLHGVAALIALRRGDNAAARAHLDAAEEHLVTTVAERESYDFLLVARSLAAVRDGDRKRALEIMAPVLDPAYAELMLRHQWLPEVLKLAQEAGADDVVFEALAVAKLEADREIVPARAHTALLRCEALATGDPEPALAAVAHYREVGRTVELAAALEEAAALLVKAGRQAEARKAFAEAVNVLTALDARWDVQRVLDRFGAFGFRHDRAVGRAGTGWEALTAVERRIAGLVANGLSNPDIAVRLSLPRRVVQAHVARILTKLGLRSRALVAKHANLPGNVVR
ncbi:BTAD domain-containing putative transcriptional regulator [Lentzea sp. NBRC 102530]|uniref:BTAD domain-containing putative transcriptional regulator n=1 Tax=Lentzea sp. NBRC 102530 TaxID=3032201 RepID=UPI00249FCD9B|nr:BTAD domain-containing putative transcriptional regulator [Lentzea sp. NBRC 102530]GLY53123.1 SARP family transcriptional regulator [Lentzea sp. NBRC 102530]